MEGAKCLLGILLWGKAFWKRARPRQNGNTDVDIRDRGLDFFNE
jgi:hypothetical protein